jgi:hypothetical protein
VLGECVVKINDIIAESAYDWFSKLSQQSKQANWSAGKGNKEEYLKNYRNKLRDIEVDKIKKIHQRDNELNVYDPTNVNTTTLRQIPNPQEGSVLLVKAANGEQYFKSYTGTWHLKGTIPQEFSVGGTKITDPAEISVLDGLLSQAKLIGVKPDPKDNTGQAFLYDQRKTALLSRRSAKK